MPTHRLGKLSPEGVRLARFARNLSLNLGRKNFDRIVKNLLFFLNISLVVVDANRPAH